MLSACGIWRCRVPNSTGLKNKKIKHRSHNIRLFRGQCVCVCTHNINRMKDSKNKKCMYYAIRLARVQYKEKKNK